MSDVEYIDTPERDSWERFDMELERSYWEHIQKEIDDQNTNKDEEDDKG